MADEQSSGTDDDLAEVIATIRALDADDLAIVEPPTDVWDGIEAAIAHDEPVRADDPPQRAVRAVTTTPSITSFREAHERRRAAQPPPSRRLSRSMLLAAAAVAVVVAGVVAFQTMRSSGPDVVATADLVFDPTAYDPLGENAVASAKLVEDDDGLGVELEDATLPGSALENQGLDLELWLLETDDSGAVVDLVSLGVVDELDHRFEVPEGYDPTRYRVVDISVEPRDGDPQHSGRTILRGPLET